MSASILLHPQAFTSRDAAEREIGRITSDLPLCQMNCSWADFAYAVGQGQSWSPVEATKGGMSDKDFISSHVIGLDFDNKVNQAQWTPLEAKTRLEAIGVPYKFFYETFSSTPENPKFRIVLDLGFSETNFKAYKALVNLFQLLFLKDNSPGCDLACISACQRFFGTNKGILFADFESGPLDLLLLIENARASIIEGSTRAGRKVRPNILKIWENSFEDLHLSTFASIILGANTPENNSEKITPILQPIEITEACYGVRSPLKYSSSSGDTTPWHGSSENHNPDINPVRNSVSGGVAPDIIDAPKSLQRVDFEDLKELDIIKKLLSEERLKHNQLFNLATNMAYIKGGFDYLEKNMKNKAYSPSEHKILRQMKNRSEKYKPANMDKFSDSDSDLRYKNVLEFLRFNRCKPLAVGGEASITLEEARKRLSTIKNQIDADQSNSVHLVLVATGVGKTEAFMDELLTSKTCLAVRRNDSLYELLERLQGKHGLTIEDGLLSDGERVLVTTSPDFETLPADLKVKLEASYKMGLSNTQKIIEAYLSKLRKEKPLGFSDNIEKVETYRRRTRRVYGAKTSILTTHHRVIQPDEAPFNVDQYIFDEDPWDYLFPVENISRLDLENLRSDVSSPGLMLHGADLMAKTEERQQIVRWIDNFLRILNESISYEPLNKLALSAETEEILAEFVIIGQRNKRLTGNIIGLYNASFCVPTKKEKPFDTLAFISKRKLPNKKTVIMSATASPEVYRAFLGDRLKVYDLRNVRLKCHVAMSCSLSAGRQSLLWKGNKKKINDFIVKNGINPEDSNTLNITFKSQSTGDLYFGACDATDKWNGANAVILGTDNKPEEVYLLTALAMGMDFAQTDKMQLMRIEDNGHLFDTYTYSHEGLRSIQKYFVLRDIVQGVGRVRGASNKEAKIVIVTGWPLKLFDADGNRINHQPLTPPRSTC